MSCHKVCFVIFVFISALSKSSAQSQRNATLVQLASEYAKAQRLLQNYEDLIRTATLAKAAQLKNLQMIRRAVINNGGDKVDVDVYYECLCPDCILFDKTELVPAVQKLSQYVDFKTYPYGNARTIHNKRGGVTFECQHGPAECYGNKLHACALYYLSNDDGIIFNSCMMGGSDRGSNDAAAERCGRSMNFDAKPIIECANSTRGTRLLEYYGEESKKANFSYVPYILINGRVFESGDFIQQICSAFIIPPPPCENHL